MGTRGVPLRPGLRRRARDDGGYTVTEMLVVLSLLTFVIAGLSGVFVSALRAEVDMNQRFEAQQNARVALAKLRRELHCAREAYVAPGGDAATIVSAVAQSGPYCKAGTSTWCALPVSAGRFALYRKAGPTCDTTGVRRADYLTAGAVFAIAEPMEFSRARVRVDLRVDVDSRDARRHYRLFDEITMRGSARSVTPEESG